MRFNRLLPAAHGDALPLADFPLVRDAHEPQEVAGDDEPAIDRLAIFAEPRPDVHRVAEIGELAFGVAAFADDDGPGVDPSPKGGSDAELGLVVGRQGGDLAFDREETGDAARVAGRVVRHRPAHDHLVADVGVHGAAEVGDRLVDVEEEAGDQIVDSNLAHRLGEARRIGEVEVHHDQTPPGGAMISPQENARQKLAAGQPRDLGRDSGDDREREACCDDLGQTDREPGFGDVPVEDELKRNSDDGQRGGHYERAEDDVGRERQPAQRGADRKASAIGRLHGPDRQAQTGPVETAAKIVRDDSLRGLVEQEAIAEAEEEPAEQARGEEGRPLRYGPQEIRSEDPALGVSSEHDRPLGAALMVKSSHATRLSLRRGAAETLQGLDATELRSIAFGNSIVSGPTTSGGWSCRRPCARLRSRSSTSPLLRLKFRPRPMRGDAAQLTRGRDATGSSFTPTGSATRTSLSFPAMIRGSRRRCSCSGRATGASSWSATRGWDTPRRPAFPGSRRRSPKA